MLLSDSDLASFEDLGYLRLGGVLSPNQISRLRAATENLRRQERDASEEIAPWWSIVNAGLKPGTLNRWESRNIVTKDREFLQLIDNPSVLLAITQILGTNICLLSSHALIRYCAKQADEGTALAWHRDLGVSSQDIVGPIPRLAVKAVYWLSDVPSPDHGAMRVVPGSHRLSGKPAMDSTTARAYGETPILASAGDVLLFEQRLWHAPAPNRNSEPRVAIFMCYGYRWLRPQDYSRMPKALLDEASPMRRQILGEAVTDMGYHLPSPIDLPLRDWFAMQMRCGPTK